jgi:microsomal dipeptidase-like Zn-dependent dipeptidase
MLAPTHRFDNALSAASEGCNQKDEQFTAAGDSFLTAVDGSRIILDLAHASDKAINEAARAVKGPVVISHTGVRKHCRANNRCDIARNMRDEEIQAIARNGGVVGLGLWVEAAGRSLQDITDSFVAAYDALNEAAFRAEMEAKNSNYDPFDHIALGSDFDGAVDTPIDAAGLPHLTQALMDRRTANGDRMFSDEAIRKIYGVNACRVFATRLPGGNAAAAEEICAPLMNGISANQIVP